MTSICSEKGGFGKRSMSSFQCLSICFSTPCSCRVISNIHHFVISVISIISSWLSFISVISMVSDMIGTCNIIIVQLYNHLALDSLAGKTPLEAAFNQVPDLSPSLHYRWWEPVHNKEEASFPSSGEKTGRWCGVSVQKMGT